jgi:site-specific recombinase XerD
MPDTRPLTQGQPLLERLRHHIRLLHYSIRTEEAYVSHVRRFILFHQKRHPAQMGAEEIRQYLSHLASDEGVAASTQNQAASAILFLYRVVLAMEMGYVAGVERAKRPARVPTVLTRAEVCSLLEHLCGTHHLMASLLYGSGLRLMECVRLRVKDLDFGYMQITVRDGKGGRDGRTVLPAPLVERLRQQLERVRLLHEEDLAGATGVCISRMRSRGSTRLRRRRRDGSGSFRQQNSRPIRAQASSEGTMPRKTRYKRP